MATFGSSITHKSCSNLTLNKFIIKQKSSRLHHHEKLLLSLFKMFNNFISASEWTLRLKILFNIVNVRMPNQARYIYIAPEGAFSHKDT